MSAPTSVGNWIIAQSIDIQSNAPDIIIWPNALMLCGDSNAHTWQITVTNGGIASSISDAIATGYFVRADGVTVIVEGTIENNVVSVTLTPECYAVNGNLRSIMRISLNSQTITLSVVIFSVRNLITDSMIVTGDIIPSFEELIAQINATEIAKTDAETAAASAEASATSVSTDRTAVEQALSDAVIAKNAAETAATSAESDAEATNADRSAVANDKVLVEGYMTRSETAATNAETSETNSDVSATQAAQALSDFLAMLGIDVATLVGGKIPMTQIPATATQEIHEITSESELVSLVAQRADLAEVIEEIDGERTVVKTYQLLGDGDATVRDNWVVWGTSYAVQAGNATTAIDAVNATMINNKRIIAMTESQYLIAYTSGTLDENTFYFTTPD